MSVQEPSYFTQQDEFGNNEKIDISKFSASVLCQEPGCCRIRFVKPQDVGQTRFCKPHARMHRLASRARRARLNRSIRNNNK